MSRGGQGSSPFEGGWGAKVGTKSVLSCAGSRAQIARHRLGGGTPSRGGHPTSDHAPPAGRESLLASGYLTSPSSDRRSSASERCRSSSSSSSYKAVDLPADGWCRGRAAGQRQPDLQAT